LVPEGVVEVSEVVGLRLLSVPEGVEVLEGVLAVFEMTSVVPPLVAGAEVELTPEELPLGVTKVNSPDCAKMVLSWSALATKLIW